MPSADLPRVPHRPFSVPLQGCLVPHLLTGCPQDGRRNTDAPAWHPNVLSPRPLLPAAGTEPALRIPCLTDGRGWGHVLCPDCRHQFLRGDGTQDVDGGVGGRKTLYYVSTFLVGQFPQVLPDDLQLGEHLLSNPCLLLVESKRGGIQPDACFGNDRWKGSPPVLRCLCRGSPLRTS